MRAKGFYNPPLAQRPKIDLVGTLGKNSLNRLIKPAQKRAKWVIKTSSKVHEPKTYNEAINDLINGNR